MSTPIFTPSKLGEYLAAVLKRDKILSDIVVEGEVSDYARNQKTGHHYFSLKDAEVPTQEGFSSYGRRESGMIAGILFAGNAGFVKELPEKGTKIRAFGQVVPYSGRSVYQLQCRRYEKVGMGEAHLLFLQMQEKLGREGYFHPKHKRKIPIKPKSLALVTASTGDAVHDMIDAVQGRCPSVELKIVPTPVQGKGAEETMALAIDWVNRHGVADVIVVGRGGGSVEDLKAYNTECLATAIFRSRIPVISAVGHEKNHVISDEVADCFVATPSRVKDLFLDIAQEKENLLGAEKHLHQLITQKFQEKQQELQYYAMSPVMQNPTVIFSEKERGLQLAQESLERNIRRIIETAQQNWETMSRSLEDLSLPQVLKRGYAVVQQSSGNVVSSVSQLTQGENLTLIFADGEVEVTAKKCSLEEE